MRPSARPLIFFSVDYDAGANRIPLNIPNSRIQMTFVQRARRKSTLPQKTAPALAKVDSPRIASVRVANRTCQGVSRLGNGNDMDMIVHEAIGPYRHAVNPGILRQQRQVEKPILTREEYPLPPVTALNDVMRYIGNNNSGHPRHGFLL